MGGYVAIAVRSNGQVECKEAHTSLISPLVRSVPLLGAAEPIAEWDALPSLVFAPLNYGLVVIDRDSHWVGHSQGYSNPALFHVNMLAYDIMHPSDPPYDEKDMFTKAWRAGAIPRLVRQNRVNPTKDEGIATTELAARMGWGSDLSGLWRHLEMHQGDFSLVAASGLGSEEKAGRESFVFEPAGWTIQRFGEDGPGYLDFAAALLKRGFALPPSSLDAWDRFLADGHDPGEGEEPPLSISRFVAERHAAALDAALPPAPTPSTPRPRV